MKKEDIYKLELHKIIKVHDWLWVVRVPGGWIYQFSSPEGDLLQITFVPFNNEFQTTK